MPTDLEMSLALQLRYKGLPDPVHQFRFHPTRRYAADLAYPDAKLLIECEGGTWSRTTLSRHTTGEGYRNDCEKYNLAVLEGFRVLRFTSDMVHDGSAVELVKRALEQKECGA